jgi:DNA-binding MarR family transcriptional regulator
MNPKKQSALPENQQDDSKSTSKSIILALRKIMQYMDIHSKKLSKLYGLTVPQIICLYEIYEHGPICISEISKNIYLSASTIVGIIDRLEENHFVIRTRELKDRRIIYLSITEKAKIFLTTSPELLHNKLDRVINDMGSTEQLTLTHSVEGVVNMLKLLQSV